VIHAAGEAGRTLHARGAVLALALIGAERVLDILAALHMAAERLGVFEGGTGTLRDERQHRVGGVAEERDAALAPFVQGRPVGERPAAEIVRRLQNFLWRFRPARRRLRHLSDAGGRIPILGGPVVAEDGNDIDLLSRGDRVVNEVSSLGEPDADMRPGEFTG
jgi:hypothetical protein